ncbi:MAG: type II toxin-antitoxin system HicA family toxin [Patescibacteria group bacterium]
MPHLSPISPKKLIKLLEREGFVCIKTKGSHYFFLNHINKRTTTVPLHGNKDIGVGLLHKIIKDIEMSAEEFKKKL